MATCDPSTLLNDAKCLECSFSPGMLPYIEIQLLIDILLVIHADADVTPEGLMDRAKCWECKVAPGQAQYVIAQLLCDILNATTP